MKRVLITVFVLVAALGVASITLAQSEPAQTPTENACYAGGAWDGKCDWPTEAEDNWAWTCGWYYARVIDGRIAAAQAPATCKFVAEQEPVDPVDPEVCDPQDDAYEFQVTQTRLSLYPYTIATPGVLANDGACGGVDDVQRGASNNLASILIYPDGSIDVLFEGAPAYVEFTYTTTNGQTANGRIDLFEAIEPSVCESSGFATICVEGDTFTVTAEGIELTSLGVLDTYADNSACVSAAAGLAGTSNITVVVGQLSEFGGAFTGDDRIYCAYRLGQG